LVALAEGALAPMVAWIESHQVVQWVGIARTAAAIGLAGLLACLAVAIPALFGYNYLLTRIKGATSDMHVFIDEFVTKLAEFYRE